MQTDRMFPVQPDEVLSHKQRQPSTVRTYLGTHPGLWYVPGYERLAGAVYRDLSPSQRAVDTFSTTWHVSTAR